MILFETRNRITNPVEEISPFMRDVVEGLRKTPKELPCKYFYDERGSILFTQICQTAEYYITRTEIRLLEQILPEVADLIGENATIVEYGSGEGRKIRNLLHSLPNPKAYVPIDISAEILLDSARKLRKEFPTLALYPQVADYSSPVSLPTAVTEHDSGKRVVFFPGSTLSNFSPAEANAFFCNLHSFLRPCDGLLLGADLIKSPNRLHQAYNDYDGVTAEFNLNILQRINRELRGNFKLHQFEHYAFFNPVLSRIEMHLISLIDQTVKIGPHHFSFSQGETIHTENSYKFSLDSITRLGQNCGFSHLRAWTDGEKLFSIHYLEAV